MSAPKFRYIGTTDECTECEKCGKIELRATVVIMPLNEDGSEDGEPCYYGSTCAARALAIPGGGPAVRKAANGARLNTLMDAHDARRMLRHYGLPETGEPTHDALRAAVREYVRSNHNVARRVAETGVKVPDMVLGMLGRKQAAIREAVLVAGLEWGKDPQPLDYGYRSVVAATMV